MDQRLLLFLIVLATDATADLHQIKQNKQPQGHEEVYYNYYFHDNSKQNHKYQGLDHQYSVHPEYKQSELKQQEHWHTEHKPQQQQQLKVHVLRQQHLDHFHHHHHYHGPEHKHHLRHHHKHHEHKHDHDHARKHHDHDHTYHEHDHKHHHHHYHEHEEEPHYEFRYGIRDPSTGDIKNQWEVRKGDDVLGEYSLVEADGTIRTVRYTAGKETGFNAIVKKEGKSRHPPASSGYKWHKKLGPTQPSKYRSAQSNPKSIHAEALQEERPKRGPYGDDNSHRVQYRVTSDMPPNHKPVFTGIDEESNLLAMYKHYPIRHVYRQEGREFDYGMGEYQYKRSYDLDKFAERLNSSARPPPKGKNEGFIRAIRGGFVMGK